MRNSSPLSVDNKLPAGVDQAFSPTVSSPSGEGASNYLEIKSQNPFVVRRGL
jgi:hypothetical protein